MEDKSLEEIVSSLSEENITVTNNEPITISMPNNINEPAQIWSQNPVGDVMELPDSKEEVKEMIEEQHSDFFNQNIEKDMSDLEKEYVKMERNAAIAEAKIIRFKADNKEIFDKLEELEREKEKALLHKDDYREVIARKLAIIGEKKWKGMEVEFTYYPASFKNVFNKKRFEAEQPNMYEKYIDKQPVKEFIKQKLSLMPIVPEDFKDGDL